MYTVGRFQVQYNLENLGYMIIGGIRVPSSGRATAFHK